MYFIEQLFQLNNMLLVKMLHMLLERCGFDYKKHSKSNNLRNFYCFN